MKRIPKFMFIGLIITTICLALGACVLLNHPKFGKGPEGARLEAIQKSRITSYNVCYTKLLRGPLTAIAANLPVVFFGWYKSAARMIP